MKHYERTLLLLIERGMANGERSAPVYSEVIRTAQNYGYRLILPYTHPYTWRAVAEELRTHSCTGLLYLPKNHLGDNTICRLLHRFQYMKTTCCTSIQANCFSFRFGANRFPAIISTEHVAKITTVDIPFSYLPEPARITESLNNTDKDDMIEFEPLVESDILTSFRRDFRTHFPFPRFIYLMPTNICNFQCAMCTYHSPDAKKKASSYYDEVRYIDETLYAQVIGEAARWKATIGFGGTGEPSLHPKLQRMVELAARRKVGSLFFNSNGGCLVTGIRDAIDYAARTVPCVVSFSVDAASKETYTRIRGTNSFEELVKSISLWASKAQGNKKLKVGVSMVRQDVNLNEEEYFINFWLQRVDQVFVSNILRDNSFYDKFHFFPTSRPLCLYLWEEVEILPTGDVIPCCRFAGLLRRLDLREISMGNLQNESLEQIWYGQKYCQMREMMLQGLWEQLPWCQNCQMWSRLYYRQEIIKKEGILKIVTPVEKLLIPIYVRKL